MIKDITSHCNHTHTHTQESEKRKGRERKGEGRKEKNNPGLLLDIRQTFVI